jgi:hypothetical protein
MGHNSQIRDGCALYYMRASWATHVASTPLPRVWQTAERPMQRPPRTEPWKSQLSFRNSADQSLSGNDFGLNGRMGHP